MSRELQLGIKRVGDIVVAAIGVVLLLPAFILIGIAIKFDSAGPVFFKQRRVGRFGKPFRMLKFRTMIAGAADLGAGVYVCAKDPRVTRVGKVLRRYSLDELPQLIHVLAGEMSLVGPRPGLPYQRKFYSEHHVRRLLARPGITGWSQVSGRNLISWPERLEKDVWYVGHWSLGLDLRILLRTALVCWSGEGLYGARENFFFTGCDDLPVPREDYD